MKVILLIQLLKNTFPFSENKKIVVLSGYFFSFASKTQKPLYAAALFIKCLI